jgi:hypothetical protein
VVVVVVAIAIAVSLELRRALHHLAQLVQLVQRVVDEAIPLPSPRLVPDALEDVLHMVEPLAQHALVHHDRVVGKCGEGDQKCQGNGDGSHVQLLRSGFRFADMTQGGLDGFTGRQDMAGSNWEEQFKTFLKRAGDDLKRMGDDIRTEAERLITEVKDPERQEKMREGIREAGHWARRAANDVADMVEKGAQKAEVAFRKFTQTQEEERREEAAPPTPRAPPTASRPEPKRRAATPAAKKKASAGPKKSPPTRAATAKKKPARSAATKKSIGRKPKE